MNAPFSGERAFAWIGTISGAMDLFLRLTLVPARVLNASGRMRGGCDPRRTRNL
jgi:hypothetical protein